MIQWSWIFYFTPGAKIMVIMALCKVYQGGMPCSFNYFPMLFGPLHLLFVIMVISKQSPIR